MMRVVQKRLVAQPALLAQVPEEAGDRSRKGPAIVPATRMADEPGNDQAEHLLDRTTHLAREPRSRRAPRAAVLIPHEPVVHASIHQPRPLIVPGRATCRPLG